MAAGGASGRVAFGGHATVLLALVALLPLGCGTSGQAAPVSPVPGAAVGEQTSLTVRLTGLQTASGEIVAALFGSAGDFDNSTNPVRSSVIAVSGPEARWEIDELSTGRYAIKVFHDLDGDGQLDRGALGVPKEPYGISNDARGRLGPPTFEDAAFQLPAGTSEMVIRVR